MSLSSILAKVSLDDSEFRKGLNRLQAQGQRFQELGDKLTIGLTAPLLAFKAQVANSFGQFDSLRRGLDAVTGSSEATAERLKVLREIAKNPGIGFQEAIQGDIRLQAVGISAEQSAKILKQFANAIALTGGGAKELNSVTVQLGQLSAKGKVLAQDLKPIIEAAPAVGQALKNMFNTVDSESIQKALESTGKNSQDFINDLLVQLEKTPRVTGGFKNAIENIKDSIFVFASTIGDSANRLFHLDTRLQNLSENTSGYAESFKNLSDGQQRAIISTGVFTASIGPVLSILGRLPGVIKSVVGGKDVLVKALASVANVVNIGKFGEGFIGFLNSSLARVPQVAVAVAALSLVYKNLGNILSSFGDFIQYFRDLYNESVIIRNVVDSISAAWRGVGIAIEAAVKLASGLIERLFGTLKTVIGVFGDSFKAVLSGNIGDIPKIFSDALNKSNKTWKDWFDGVWEYGKNRFYDLVNIISDIGSPSTPARRGGGIGAVNIDQVLANKAKNNTKSTVNKPILSATTNVDSFADSLKKLEEELKKQQNLLKIWGEGYDAITPSLNAHKRFIEEVANEGPRATLEIEKSLLAIEKLQRGNPTVSPVIAQLKINAEGLFATMQKLEKQNILTAAGESINSIDSGLSSVREQFANIDRIAQSIRFDTVAAKMDVLRREFEKGTISASTFKTAMGELDTTAYKAGNALKAIASGFANFSFSLASTEEVRSAVAGLTAEIEKQREILFDSSATEAQKQAALAQIALIQKQIQAEKDKGNIVKQVSIAIVRSIKDSIRAYIAQAIAGLIAHEASTKGIIGLALAGIGAGIAFTLFETLVPKLAKGGLAFGPTLAMVGDNRNAKNDPEVIAPLSKLKAMLNDGGFGGGNIRVYGTLEGNDIRVSNQYATAYYGRLN